MRFVNNIGKGETMNIRGISLAGFLATSAVGCATTTQSQADVHVTQADVAKQVCEDSINRVWIAEMLEAAKATKATEATEAAKAVGVEVAEVVKTAGVAEFAEANKKTVMSAMGQFTKDCTHALQFRFDRGILILDPKQYSAYKAIKDAKFRW